MEIFSCSTKIISGPGSLSALEGLGIQRLFLVTDPFFQSNGLAAKVAAMAHAQAVEVYADVKPDPTLTLAADATAKAKAFAPDTIVALGGGSAMDLSKAVAFFSGKEARLVAVPTTSGSGSEVTDFAILTHDQVKHPLVDASVRPEVAILDGDLLTHLPASLIADGGFDIITHALEAWVAKNAGSISDSLAQSAFVTALTCLPGSYAGDRSQRLKIHEAATMAGLAFSQAGLGLCHAMAHTLGGLTHLPHGRLNGILLPWVLEVNAHAAGEKYGRLCTQAGLGVSRQLGVRNLKNALLRLRRELKMPDSLRCAGVDIRLVENHREQIVNATLADPCCATNPVAVDGATVRKILEAIK